MTEHIHETLNVEGGAHMDFYDVPKYVERAVAEATPFFEEHLRGADS